VNGPAEAIIARPGWVDQRTIQISPPSCAWRTDGPGSFDCTVRTRDLTTAGMGITQISTAVKGRWLWWEHPTAGAWGGVITRTEIGPWYTRITAEQFNVLMRKRQTAQNVKAVGIAPGSLALYYLTSAARSGDSFLLTGWTAQEGGDAVDLEPRGGDLCDDIIPDLARYGYQWRVRAWTMAERLFEFRERLGVDKRGTVLLSEGRHIVGIRVTGDLWTVANSIIGISGDRVWDQSYGYQQDDDASIRALGRRYEETIAYTGVITRSTIAPLVKRDLAVRRYPQEITEIDLVDADMCFLDFREGDTVRILSAQANSDYAMDVDIRSLDAGRNILTIAGRLRTDE